MAFRAARRDNSSLHSLQRRNIKSVVSNRARIVLEERFTVTVRDLRVFLRQPYIRVLTAAIHADACREFLDRRRCALTTQSLHQLFLLTPNLITLSFRE